jgi:endonuclease YncB( thermonuclease family)
MSRKWLVSLLITVALLVGCSDVTPTTLPDAKPPASTGATENRTASATGQRPPADQAGCLAAAPAPPKEARRAQVARAVDGDTLEFTDGTKARLIGINTPESVDPRRPVQAYGKEAAAYTRKLTEGKEVQYVLGRTPRDKYGRLLAWVWLSDGTFLNALLVRDGYAQVYTFADNPDHADLLLACQREAREANRGLWALPEYHNGQQAAEMDRSESDAGLTITQAPGTVSRGATATVAVKTTPGASCSITVIYKSGPSEAQGLSPKQADGAGNVSWSWKVGSSTTPGTWPVIITCGGQTVQTAVTVQ